MNNDIEKRLKKLEKQKKPLKKFKFGEYESDTKLDPFIRKKVSVRDIEDLIEDENESEEN